MNKSGESIRILTAKERLQALVLAAMNEERAELCSADQPALRKVFEMNAALLRSFAQ